MNFINPKVIIIIIVVCANNKKHFTPSPVLSSLRREKLYETLLLVLHV